MVNPYEVLANAIILQAVKDYRQAIKLSAIKADGRRPERLKGELEAFFLSPWFAELTTMDGKRLLQRLQDEMGGNQ